MLESSFSYRFVSKWNMLDGDTVYAKTVNKTKSERQRVNKMGLVLHEVKPAGPRGRHGDSILQVSCKYLVSHISNREFHQNTDETN